MSQDLKNFTLNRLINPNAQFSIGNWVAFADAAATSPVDGTGGSPNSTITRTESTPLDGVASLLFTKNSGASRQGEGASTDIVLQASDATKVFTLSVDYQITTGTYTEGTSTTQSDLTWWFYDVTNAVMYQMTPSNINGAVSTTNQYSMQAQVQIPVGCLTGRLIMYIPTTANASCTLRFNNITFGRLPRVQGTIDTPWQSYTPTLNGFGTATSIAAWWRRVGSEIEVRGNFTSGTCGATVAAVSIPPGMVFDSSVDTFGSALKGEITIALSTTTGYRNTASLFLASGATNALSVSNLAITSNAKNFTAIVANTIFNDSIVIGFQAKGPILGWGANGTLGQDADTRTLSCMYSMATGATIVTYSTLAVNYATQTYDNFGGVTTGVGFWRCTAPVAGIWNFTCCMLTASAIDVEIFKNGAAFKYLFTTTANKVMSSTIPMNLIAGDYVEIRGDTGTTTILSSNALANYFGALRAPGPAQVQASEIITARYSTNAGQSISNNTITIIDFEDVSYDDHGAVTTGSSWKFTCPRAGKVNVSARAQLASNAGWAVGENAYLSVFKNGVEFGRGPFDSPVTATIVVDLSVEDEVNVIAGDTIDIRIFQLSGGTIALVTTNVLNYVCINYVGGIC